MAEQDSEHSIHVVLLPNPSQGHINPILTVRQAPRRAPRRPVHTRREPVRARPERRAVPGGGRRRPHRRNLRRLRPRRLRRGRRDRGVHGPAGVGRVGDRGRAPPVRGGGAGAAGARAGVRRVPAVGAAGGAAARRRVRGVLHAAVRGGRGVRTRLGRAGGAAARASLVKKSRSTCPGSRPADLPMFLTDPDDRGYLDLLVNQFGGLDTADQPQESDYMASTWRAKTVGPAVPSSAYLDNRLPDDTSYGFHTSSHL